MNGVKPVDDPELGSFHRTPVGPGALPPPPAVPPPQAGRNTSETAPRSRKRAARTAVRFMVRLQREEARLIDVSQGEAGREAPGVWGWSFSLDPRPENGCPRG